MEPSVETPLGRVLADLMDASVVFAEATVREVAAFGSSEVVLGQMLGKGSFGVVSEVMALEESESETATAKMPSPNQESKKADSEADDSRIRTKHKEDDDLGKTTTMTSSILLTSTHGHHRRLSQPRLQDNINVAEFEAHVRMSLHLGTHAPEFSWLDNSSSSDDDEEEKDDPIDFKELTALTLRRQLSSHVFRDGMPRYAVKRIRQDLKTQQEFSDAMIDLACEAKYLQSITHSNIVRLRGMVATPGTKEFGILLDRLIKTLPEQLVEWHNAKRNFKGPLGLRVVDEQGKKSQYLERLWVVYDVGRALRYLHSKRIVNRDIKPANVGFNVRGFAQIFDFGLSKELKRKDLVQAPDGYDATGLTGSQRYMAPEVVLCQPYGFSSEVYSYAIFFYEVMALKVPYEYYDSIEHNEQVVLKGKRPPLKGFPSLLSKNLLDMVEAAWAQNPINRLSMKHVCDVLQMEIDSLQGNTTDLSASDRSDHLLEKSRKSLYRRTQAMEKKQ